MQIIRKIHIMLLKFNVGNNVKCTFVGSCMMLDVTLLVDNVLIVLFISCIYSTCAASHKLFKGIHKIGGIRLNIEKSHNVPMPAEVHNPSPPINSNDNVGSSVRTSSATLESISLDPSILSMPGKGPSVQTARNITAPSVQQEDKQSSLRESPHTGREQTGWSDRVIMEQPKGQPGTHKPTHIGSTSKDRNPSYIIVSCLVNSISTEDIVAYFQTARCGEGTVTEVINLGQSKALVGISGIELNCKLYCRDCNSNNTCTNVVLLNTIRLIYTLNNS